MSSNLREVYWLIFFSLYDLIGDGIRGTGTVVVAIPMRDTAVDCGRHYARSLAEFSHLSPISSDAVVTKRRTVRQLIPLQYMWKILA